MLDSGQLSRYLKPSVFEAVAEIKEDTPHSLYEAEENKLLDTLLLFVAHGKQEQAEAILEKNPALLFISSDAAAPSGDRFMDYSPCRLACYSHDMDMLKMMKKYAYRVPYGEEQFNQLLKETNESFKHQKTYDFNQLENAFQQDNEEQIKLAISNFRKHFEPKYIKNTESFNIENFLNAYEIYIKNYAIWSDKQCCIFWCEVIGFLQSTLPACYAQTISSEKTFFEVTDENKPLKRNLILHNGRPFYSQEKNKLTGLGYDFAIYGGVQVRALAKTQAIHFKHRLEKYVKQKQEQSEKLTQIPTFNELLQDTIDLCPEKNQKSYFYLLALLMKNFWGAQYKADTGESRVCNKDGLLSSESHELILSGLTQILDKLEFSNDFIRGYLTVSSGLKAEYLKLILKQKDFFETFELRDGDRTYFPVLLKANVSENNEYYESAMHYILTKCDPKTAKQYILNAKQFDLQTIDDIWTDITIYELFNLEKEQAVFDLLLNKIPSNILELIIKEPNNNPFNNQKAKLWDGFDEILDRIGPKLKAEDLSNLILNSDIASAFIFSSPSTYNKLCKLLPASLLFNIFLLKDLLPKAFDLENNSNSSITLPVILIIQAALEQTNPHDQNEVLKHLAQKYVICKNYQTNFLGYFILRDNDAEDSNHYRKIFSLISSPSLLDIFKWIGIKNYTISLALLEQILQKIPQENISDIFEENFQISDTMKTGTFAHFLFDILSNPNLSTNNITQLLKRIPYKKLASLVISESYANLNIIRNADRKKFILKTISIIISAGEYKAEKEQKNLNHHQFFQSVPNKRELSQLQRQAFLFNPLTTYDTLMTTPNAIRALNNGWITIEQTRSCHLRNLQVLLSDNGIYALENNFITIDEVTQYKMIDWGELLSYKGIYALEKNLITVQQVYQMPIQLLPIILSDNGIYALENKLIDINKMPPYEIKNIIDTINIKALHVSA